MYEIKIGKTQSFQDFVIECRNKNPLRIVYKYVTNKKAKDPLGTPHTTKERITTNWQDTVNSM